MLIYSTPHINQLECMLTQRTFSLLNLDLNFHSFFSHLFFHLPYFFFFLNLRPYENTLTYFGGKFKQLKGFKMNNLSFQNPPFIRLSPNAKPFITTNPNFNQHGAKCGFKRSLNGFKMVQHDLKMERNRAMNQLRQDLLKQYVAPRTLNWDLYDESIKFDDPLAKISGKMQYRVCSSLLLSPS